MDYDLIIFASIMIVFLTLMLNWIYFFDWTYWLGKMVHVMNPQRRDQAIEWNQMLRKNESYRAHVKKWKRIFLLHPLTCLIAFLIIVFTTKQLLIAYFGALIATVVQYGILGHKEQKEKRAIMNRMKKKDGAERKRSGDGSKNDQVTVL